MSQIKFTSKLEKKEQFSSMQVFCSSVQLIYCFLLVVKLTIPVNCSMLDRAMYSAQYTVYIVQCTVHSVQFTVKSVQCTVYSVQCSVYGV